MRAISYVKIYVYSPKKPEEIPSLQQTEQRKCGAEAAVEQAVAEAASCLQRHSKGPGCCKLGEVSQGLWFSVTTYALYLGTGTRRVLALGSRVHGPSG